MNPARISRVLSFADNRLVQQLYGQYDQHLAILQEALGVEVHSRGSQVVLDGPEASVQKAAEALEALYRLLQDGQPVDASTVRAAARFTRAGDARLQIDGTDVTIQTRRRKIQPRTVAQAEYIRKVRAHKLTFALGPAGTGKTYLAVAAAVAAMAAGEVERLVLSRPAVEAGERIGFLPGDMKEKVDPYLRPLYDALGDMLPGDLVQRQIDAGSIEIAPLAFMRGRTLAHAFVILDEAQNTTPQQMMMFLTRFGEGSRMVVCGDPDQVDLPPGAPSGLSDAVRRLEGLPEISVQRFSAADVVRDPLVSRIVTAYQQPRNVVDAPAGKARPEPSVAQHRSRLVLDIVIEAAEWTERLPDVESRLERAAMAAWDAVGLSDGGEISVAVLLSDDASLQELNKRFRDTDKPTNVLSFPNDEDWATLQDEPRHLGDIAVAYETVAREAVSQEKTLEQHLGHMIVHGLLHLLGYDHQMSAEQERMETIERDILATIGIPDPFGPDVVDTQQGSTPIES